MDITEQYIVKNYLREQEKRSQEHEQWAKDFEQRNKTLLTRYLTIGVSIGIALGAMAMNVFN